MQNKSIPIHITFFLITRWTKEAWWIAALLLLEIKQPYPTSPDLKTVLSGGVASAWLKQ